MPANLIINNPGKLFVDAPAHDLHLRKDARAIDAGSPDLAPDIDCDKVSRPWGGGYDIGAYEYHEGEVGINSLERKELKTRENPKVEQYFSGTRRQQVPADLATDRSVERDREGQAETQQQADSFGSSTTASWLLALVAASLLAGVRLMRR